MLIEMTGFGEGGRDLAEAHALAGLGACPSQPFGFRHDVGVKFGVLVQKTMKQAQSVTATDAGNCTAIEKGADQRMQVGPHYVSGTNSDLLRPGVVAAGLRPAIFV